MTASLEEWRRQLADALKAFGEQVKLRPGQVFVVGCSTSEVAGQKIGTAGTEEIAEMIYLELVRFTEPLGVKLAFQCCEHLNRAIVTDRKTAEAQCGEEVTVVPVRTAGGAMAAYAFNHVKDPIVIEFVKADAGIDIGDTFIGMHLKHVAVPIRTGIQEVGSAHVTMAATRPKLIGGARAVYERDKWNNQCT